MDENTEVSYVFSGDDVIGSYTTTEVDGEKLDEIVLNPISELADLGQTNPFGLDASNNYKFYLINVNTTICLRTHQIM